MSNTLIEIGSVTLAVRDLDRVARFYEDAIGLAAIETKRLTRSGSAPAAASSCNCCTVPHFLPVDPQAAGLFHTAFLLPTRTDLGRWLRHADPVTSLPIDGAADHLVSEAVYLGGSRGQRHRDVCRPSRARPGAGRAIRSSWRTPGLTSPR